MAEKSAAVTVNAKFKNVNLGDETARLGIEIPCGEMQVMKAVSLFRGSQCKVTITLGDKEQEDMLGAKGIPVIESVVNFKSVTIKQKVYNVGLTFNLADVTPEEIAHFAQQSGHISVERIGAIPEKPKKSDDSDDED